MRRGPACALLCACALPPAASAQAIDYSLSGFGTLGYARSNRSYTYQRFIDDGGTFQRDSVAGVQFDARLGERFGATLQLKAAAATDSDRRYEASVAWAFVSYRPSNDWLIRLGKQRIPFYLYSETVDVGVTYDFARLPIEMYSISPTNDDIGISVSKSWASGSDEWTLEAYAGRSKTDFRVWHRDALPGIQAAGAEFLDLDFKGGGLVITYRGSERTLRLGVHHATVRVGHDGVGEGYPFVEVAPGTGIGYYQVSSQLPGPGEKLHDHVTNSIVTAGVEWPLPGGLKVVGEFARNLVPRIQGAPRGNRGYVSLLGHRGGWTPYLTYSFLRSPDGSLDFYRLVNENRLPPPVPNAALINALQRAGADALIVFDQHSWALGTSYTFSAKSKLKAELMRTRIGSVSKLVDAPPGGDIAHRDIDILSISYNLVF